MPSDRYLRAANSFHRTVLRLTRGRVGWTAGRMPVLELTTIGRRSSRPHTVMLTSPVQDGDTIVLVASRGGDDHHPAWFHNLCEHPTVQGRWRGQPTQSFTARVADPVERERWWARVIATQPRYAEYQAKTTREIPIVLLDATD